MYNNLSFYDTDKIKSRFETFTTDSPGKFATIQWQMDRFKSIYGETKFDGYGVTLPGKGSQLARHRDELFEYGIKEENQIMVDISANVCHSLRQAAKEINFKGKIIEDDFYHVVRRLWAQGKQVDVIDFDDVGHLKPNHCWLIADASTRNVKMFVLVLTNRGAKDWTPYLNDWRVQLKIPELVWREKRNSWRKPWREVQEGAIASVCMENSLNWWRKVYQGVGNTPMESFLLFPPLVK